MDLAYARSIAESVVARLAPTCERVMVCGSIRRHKKEVSDLDIVVLPIRDAEKDMFGTITCYRVIPEFIACVNQWTKIKGEPTGRYTQRLLKDGRKLEISIAYPDNYGALCMIRTGDDDFSRMMVTRALDMNMKQEGGFLHGKHGIIPIRDEEDYFRVLELPYIEPSKRDKNAFR